MSTKPREQPDVSPCNVTNKKSPLLDFRFPASVREWLTERTGKTSVPQIFFNGKHIGGNEELQAIVADEDKWRQEVR